MLNIFNKKYTNKIKARTRNNITSSAYLMSSSG